MEAQRSRLHQLPHHNGTSDHNRHRQQRPQPRTLPHTRRIQRHPPQPGTRPPHQYHRQHGHHHADTQRIQRERYTHIRTHRIKRNQRTLRLDNPHAHRTTCSRRMHIQRTWRRHRHRTDRTGPAIDIRTDANRAQHLLRLSGCLIQRLRRHRIHTNIFRRAIRIDLHICLRRIGDLQQPLVSTFEPRAQHVVRGGGITRCGQGTPKRHIAQHALDHHHHRESDYNGCAHTTTCLKTLLRKSHVIILIASCRVGLKEWHTCLTAHHQTRPANRNITGPCSNASGKMCGDSSTRPRRATSTPTPSARRLTSPTTSSTN